jgi:hypothetical protein
MMRRTLFEESLPDGKQRAALRIRGQLLDELTDKVSRPFVTVQRTALDSVPRALLRSATFRTSHGALIESDCLKVLSQLPNDSLDLVVTSPPYDGQPKYGNGEQYDRSWYQDFFLEVTREIHRTLRPHGSFVLNYRSKRCENERGTLQFELVFWLRKEGFLFCEDLAWGKPSPALAGARMAPVTGRYR